MSEELRRFLTANIVFMSLLIVMGLVIAACYQSWLMLGFVAGWGF